MPKVDVFIVYRLCLGRKWTNLPFRGHVWVERGQIYHLDAISGSKVDGFIV